MLTWQLDDFAIHLNPIAVLNDGAELFNYASVDANASADDELVGVPPR
jgi:hypothetical protein